MGILAVDSIKSRTVAPVTVSDDLNVTGVSTVGVLTATSVVVGSGVTVNADGVITSGIVTATTFQGNVNGTTGTFSGDVSIGGTLTYEDVERVDATGISTFREGLNVGSPTGVGGTFNPQGDISAGIGSFSGAISGGAGTFTGDVSIADKIIHTGDTNTAIRFPAVDTITAETAGNETIRVTSAGLVGIGTNNPGELLHLNTSSGNCKIRIDAAATPSLEFYEAGTRNSDIMVDHSSNNLIVTNRQNANIIFRTNGTNERLRITSTGAISLNNGELIERCYIQSSPAWGSNGAVDLDNGVVQYNSSNYGSSPGTLAFTSSVGINTQMATGDIMSLTMITAVNNAGGYINNIQIDGIAATETWVGGAAPTGGGTSGVDTYAFNIIKTADATFLVIANQVKTS